MGTTHPCASHLTGEREQEGQAMTRTLRTTLLLTAFAAAPLAAQMTGTQPPPSVLLISRELVKPGKSAAHNQWETGWPAAFAKANYPTNYLGMNAVSGINEAWFLVGFPSFDAMERDNARMEADVSLRDEQRRLYAGESDFVESTRSVLAAYVPAVSHNPNVDLSKMRYFEVITYTMRPGRSGDFIRAAGLVRDGFTKAKIDTPWATYQAVSGAPAGTYYVFLPFSSLAALDKGPSNWAAMIQALGPEQAGSLGKLVTDGVATEQSQIFALNPKMSYVSKEMKAADPFWR
jgi:hypothetical protein